jgi:Zn-dependent protease
MSWSIRLLRIKGIDVKVHLTFVLILVWAAYRWSASTGEGLRGALFGVVATLLLFGAVTLHELGHSFQARKFGVQVRDITLMPMGGLARLDEVPRQPGQELRIALAGPLVNFAIAGALIVAGFLLHTSAVVTIPQLVESLGQANWRGMLSYLTMANLLLGIFNLIPAFPMDGGRVLRAVLSLRTDRVRATRMAANVGQTLAVGFGILGLFGNPFLILIAVFIWIGAGAEASAAEVEERLHRQPVRRAMITDFQVLGPHDPLARAIDLTLAGTQKDFPVVDGFGGVVGVLPQTAILRGLRDYGTEGRVGDIMEPATTADISDTLSHLLENLQQGETRLICIQRGGRLVGLVDVENISEFLRIQAALRER